MNIYLPYSLDRDVLKGMELKYALRSIEKYLKGWSTITIIGDTPEFLRPFTTIPGANVLSIMEPDAKMFCIRCANIPAKKEQSIFKKMRMAAELDSKGIFIMWHDDHYLLKPLHVSELKTYHAGPLKDYKGNYSARYREALNNTIEAFPNGLYYDIHTPCIFSSHEFLQLNWDREYCLKSLYYNTFLSPWDEQIEDLKFNNYVSKDYIKTLIKGRLFFSTGCMHDPMVEVLNELFPDKSRFEI